MLAASLTLCVILYNVIMLRYAVERIADKVAPFDDDEDDREGIS